MEEIEEGWDYKKPNALDELEKKSPVLRSVEEEIAFQLKTANLLKAYELNMYAPSKHFALKDHISRRLGY